jgi:hypothetical protein
MSAPGPATEAAPPPPEPGPADGTGRHGCLTALLILGGVALLLPGLCSLVFMVPFLVEGESAGGFVLIWLITFVIAAGGIALIRYALRNR